MRKAFAHIPRTTLLAGIMLMALASCKPKRPAGVLSPSQMENLLVDYHLAQGMAEAESNGRNTDELRYIYIHAALKKHHIDEAVFDSSMVYYSGNSELFAPICARVCARIEAMAGGMGSSESGSSRQGKYAHLTAQGDTANVWTGLQHATLMPDVLHNLLVLTWRADSTTRLGDSFIWHCYTQKVAQSNLSDAFAQMILRFENDTVVNTTVHIYGDRETELYWRPTAPLDTMKLKSVTAMLFMSPQQPPRGNERSKNTAEALLIRDIALVRMHKKVEETSTTEDTIRQHADTLAVEDTIASSQEAKAEQPDNDMRKHRLSPAELREAQPHESTINVKKELPAPTHISRRNLRPARSVKK